MNKVASHFDAAEVQRVSVVAVTGVMHRVTKSVSCCTIFSSQRHTIVVPQTTLPTGHVVPKGSIAMTNIKKFLTDPELWDQPEQFNPERWNFEEPI